MNKIKLKGTIKNIQPSHITQGIEYNKANLIVRRDDGKEDIITLKFKRFSNPYNENDEISLTGNLRTYSSKLADKNKVEVYVFTYFDEEEFEESNLVEFDGRVCKKNDLRKTAQGKDVIDFIVANNIKSEDQSLNCYIPCVAWGKAAKQLSNVNIGDLIEIKGQIRSREYRKKVNDDDFEIHVCHEVNIIEFKQG